MLFTHSASFSTPAPPAGLSAAAPNSTGTSPPGSSRSRFRRLSQLRYNPGHLLSRDTTSTSSTTPAADNSLRRSSTADGNNTVPRSPQSAGTTRNHRLTLINSAPMSPHAPSAAAEQTTAGLTNSATAVNLNPSPPMPPLSATLERTQQAPSLEISDSATSRRPNSTQAIVGAQAIAAASSLAARTEQASGATATLSQESASQVQSGAVASAASNNADMLPSIRLSAYFDPRSTRPSLTFPQITRTLPTGTESIRVGRYSERDSQSNSNMPNNIASAAPVGFKSKVVSRRHCEFWHENGKWYIKDIKSSSGTFLNHIRLSGPSQQSKPFPLNDGDIVQLGIDFKGGEEAIYRCVKMRVELNRGWQNKLNSFNMAAHQQLRKLATSGPANSAANAAGSTSQDCAICLNSIAPCQSLFVAPCSHTWHFKCIRSLLLSPSYPVFMCPNCRAGADLEADVDDAAEDWEQVDAQGEEPEPSSTNGAPLTSPPTTAVPPQLDTTIAAAAPGPASAGANSASNSDTADATMTVSPSDAPTRRDVLLPSAASQPVLIRNPPAGSGSGTAAPTRSQQTPSPPTASAEGPITPRNEAGPWVFDGSAGQRPQAAAPGMGNMDAAADITLSGDSSDTSMR